jgi:hypothetical protein
MSRQSNRSAQSQSDLPIVMYFRLRSSTGQFVSCRSFRTSGGIELRFGPDEGPAEMSTIVGSHQAARELAATWRATLTSKGAFSELHIATHQSEPLRPTRRR